ncbi:hypothetical protein BIFCAT_00093 [Bifidobacterium catenulatum DSM 16992 = JCM 1194 = LMG 11043]|uniref:Uncharacterized protein n=1 Tax=Bifidobacterium catenulatum DSM 16992 = JCM 1194 = LMG 11043 TaxID=566552 RepID=B6XS87_9BIFI|nr:hypothetical protein BIFCAT_00093 [Bifidobacterium catenulatum DSM 16992 = JCM 1194 = LMG 11043]
MRTIVQSCFSIFGNCDTKIANVCYAGNIFLRRVSMARAGEAPMG